MRIVLFFDLPTLTNNDLKEYRKFIKFIKKNGFYMLQESVYIKLCMDQRACNAIIGLVKENKPSDGSVILFSLTEKQFNDMEIIVGNNHANTINSLKRVVVL